MIVQGLITYRNVFLRSNAPKLEDIRTKLAEIAVRESAEQLDGDLIEEVVEKINQREPDVIREMRCHLRRNRLAPRTEKAYVRSQNKKLTAFPAATALGYPALHERDLADGGLN